jgi:hypothetical protein
VPQTPRATTDTNQIGADMAKGTCTSGDCEREVWAKGLCGKHYGRMWRTGSLELTERPDEQVSFWAKVDRDGPLSERAELGNCWVWTGYVMPSGYGFWQANGNKTSAHRYAYELANGTIQTGLHIDHLCRNRACVRGEHLEAVTQAENNRRAGPTRVANKTHCPGGHAYAGENLYIAPNGQRVCRTCRGDRVRAFKAKRREEAR